MQLFIATKLLLLDTSIRRVLKLAFVFGPLAVCLCYAAGVSAAAGVTVESTKFYDTVGSPTRALVTPDDNYVLVSVTGHPAGVQVFASTDFNNPCSGKNNSIIEFPSVNGNSITSVQGMQFLPSPDGVSVGAAVEDQGAEFFNLSDLTTCSIDGKQNVVNVPQRPMESASVCAKKKGQCAPGSFDVALTPTGAPGFAFVANEYGAKRLGPDGLPAANVNFGLVGTVGVVRIQRNSAGGFTPGTQFSKIRIYTYRAAAHFLV